MLVDGAPVTELGIKVDPDLVRVEVDGRVFEPEKQARAVYYLLNKPKGVVCTNDRREARKRAIDLITDPAKGRIYTVGRLDEASTGLILLTNDGEFANLIAHPRHEVPKTYLVKVRGKIDGVSIDKLKRGVHLAEGRTTGLRVRVYKKSSTFSTLSVTLAEGKNREVRRIFARVGFNVISLRRTRIGNLSDRRLKEGQWRPLLRAELKDLIGVAQGEIPVGPERSGSDGKRPGRRPAGRGSSSTGSRSSTAAKNAPRGKPSPKPGGRGHPQVKKPAGGRGGPGTGGRGAGRATGGRSSGAAKRSGGRR